MIRIRRGVPPASLTRAANRQTPLDCKTHDTDPSAYASGTKKIPDKKYYASDAVKQTLLHRQNWKCCYCERRMQKRELEVEHIRPKRGFRQSASQKKDEYPGYYWLAYSWDNLLLACGYCNGTKSTVFPLLNPSLRSRTHHDDISRERSMLIDPSREEPRRHI